MPAFPSSASLLGRFSALSDPRQQWRAVHPPPEILLLILCATLCGMEDFVEIRLWGERRFDFLRRRPPSGRGLPSHDTLNDTLTGAPGFDWRRDRLNANSAEAHEKRTPANARNSICCRWRIAL